MTELHVLYVKKKLNNPKKRISMKITEVQSINYNIHDIQLNIKILQKQVLKFIENHTHYYLHYGLNPIPLII